MKVVQKSFWKVTTASLLAAGIIGLSGTSAFEEELRQEATYCENVATKVWPDYEGEFSEVCPQNRPAKNGLYGTAKPLPSSNE